MASLKAEYEIADGQRAADHIRKGENRLYSFTVPNDPDIDTVTVDVYVGTANSSNLNLFVAPAKDKDSVPSSSNTILTFASWLGITAVTSASEWGFARGCKYRALVNSKADTSFVLSYRTNKGVTEIANTGIDLYDSVGFSARKCYQYNLRRASDDILSVYMKLYSGYAELHANPLTLPNPTAEFAFGSQENGDIILSITKEDREKARATTGIYYICVSSFYYASYNIMVLMQNPQEIPRLPIYSGVTRAMRIKKDDFILFEYTLEEKRKLDLEFTLVSASGNADLYVKYCIYTFNPFGYITNNCDLEKAGLNSNDVMKSTSSESIDYITTTFEPSMCIGKNVRCSYLVGVLGVSSAKFDLSLATTDDAEVPLAEGVPFFGTVDRREKSKFAFAVKDREATAVKIQLTSHSGDADLEVSKDPDVYPKYSYKGLGMVDIVEFTKEDNKSLDAVYHVTVSGYTVATFTLVYRVDSPRRTNSSTDLYDGRPHTGVLGWSYFREVYRFGVSFSQELTRDIRVFLLPIAGRYRVYAGVNYVPTASNYTWALPESSNSFLISSKDPKYAREGLYYILVEKLYRSDNTAHVYTVKFVTGQYATTLFEGVPEVGNLTKGDIAYYKFFIVNATNDVTVSVMPLSGDPNLYVSVNSSNQLPSSKNYDFVSALVGADAITIPAKTIKERNKHCAEGYYTGSNCGIYIAVACATEECAYSLQLSAGTQLAQRLLEGIPHFAVAEPNSPAYFVFTPNVSTTTVSIQPIRGAVKAYLLIVPPGRSLYRYAEMPGPKMSNKTSQSVANSEVFVLNREEIQKCGNGCELYMGVYAEGEADYAEFNVVATSVYVWLTDGRAVTDHVETNGYRYYKYYVSCTKCTLTISLVPFSRGDPDLYVNKGPLPPSREKADFKSANYRDDVLEIDWEDDFFKNNQKETMRGEYTIAVYGYENCTYTLTAASSSTNLQELSFGVPTRVQQYAGEVTYYAFTLWRESSVKVSLVMMHGRAVIRANVVELYGSDGINEFLPTKEENSVWSSLRAGTNNYLIISKDDSKYSRTGTYLVGVEAKEDSNFDIMVEYVSDSRPSHIDMERPRRFTLLAGEVVNLEFVIHTYENITCGLYVNYGTVTAKISRTLGGESLWDLKSNSDLILSPSDRNFGLGYFYITVTAQANSDFVIQLREISSFAWLSEGLPQSGVIANGQMVYYKYKLNRRSSSNEYVVNVHIKFSQRVTDAALLIKYAVDDTRPNQQYVDRTLTYDSYLNSLSGAIVVDASKTDVVSMALTVVAVSPVQYTVNVWSSGILLLVPGREYINGFRNVSETQVYELTSENASKITLETTLCTGRVNVTVSKNLLEASSLAAIEEKRSVLTGSFDATYGSYYITVQPTSLDAGTNDAWYMIRAVSGALADAGIFTLGNEGRVQHELKDGALTVSWGKVTRRDGGEAKDVTYAVFANEEGKGNMDTACGIILGGAERVSESTRKTKAVVKLRGNHRGKVLVVNVLAIVQDPWTTLAYNAVRLEGRSEGGFSIFKAIIILAVLGIVGAVVYYRQKMTRQHHSQPQLVPDPPSAQSELRDIGPVTQYASLQ